MTDKPPVVKGNEDSTIYFFRDFQRAAEQTQEDLAVLRKLLVRKDTTLQRRIANVRSALELEQGERQTYIDQFFEDAKKNVVRKANRLHEDVDLFRMMQGVDDQTQHSNLLHTEREIQRLRAGLCMVADDWNTAVKNMDIPPEMDPSRTGASPPPDLE